MSTAAVEFEPIDPYDLPLRWADACPGPELAIQLARVEWASLSDRELVDAMEAARRQATWAQSLMLEGVGELARRREHDDPVPGSERHRRICGEISLELTVPTGQAEELVWLADTLPSRLPATWAALRAGRIDYHRARVVADGLATLDDDLARRLEAELIAAAVEDTTTLLRRRLSRAVRKADPDAAAQRTKRSRAERRVELWDHEDDTCDLVGRHLDAVDAHAIYNRLTAAAQAMKADGDQRPIDHIRLDLCRDLLRGVPLPEATCQLITAPLAAEDTGHLDDADPTGGIAPPREADQPIDIRQTADQHTDRHADPSVDLALAAQMSDTGSTEPAPHLLDQASDTGSTEPAPHLLDQPAAARASHEAPHHIGQGPGPGRTARPGRARPAAGVRGSGLDSITAQAERQIAYALAHAADERLTGVFERARREGRLDGMARLIGEAVEAMRDALDPLVDSWCRATSPAPRPANGPHDTLDTGARARGAHGRDGYRPPATLQRLIQRRHATCVYPSCHRRSRRCDLDHTKPYDRGGRTCRCNLAPLCRAHHRLFKQHWQWKLIQLWPGLLIWIAPAGTWHIVLPE